MTNDTDGTDKPDVVVVLDVAGGPEVVDVVEGDLWAAGATAVSESRTESGPDGVTLIASFPTPEAAYTVARELGGRPVEIIDTSWRDRWKDFAAPVEVGGLVVAPAWREVPVAGDRLVVRIDPGPCFGSGSHPSTRLVLSQLMGLGALAGRRVLDVGCGSGIGSVTAALLGASVVAIDIDPDAVAYTRTNAEANGVPGMIEASRLPVDAVGANFDVTLVNVTAAVHATIGPAATKAVKRGGTLLLAGLLPGQWRHVAGAYEGAEVMGRPELDGWEGVTLRRR